MKLYTVINQFGRIKIFLLFIILFAEYGYSQFNDDNIVNSSVDLFRKPPEAAQLSRMIDIPAGNYTGVANFTIPIFTIQVDGIDLPIGLSYGTTGIKVDDIAGRVGLGWSLNTGGIHLSKQVYGMPDREYGYRNILESIPEGINEDDTFLGTNFQYSGVNKILMDANGLYLGGGVMTDVIPDIFSYSLYNSSGKFIMDSKGNGAIPIPFTKSIKTFKNTNGNLEYIKDDSGNSYYFRSKGPNEFQNLNCKPTGPSTFFIEDEKQYDIGKILTKNNKEVNFVYNKHIPNAQFATSKTETRTLYVYKSNFVPTFNPTPPTCVNYMHLNENILTDITFPEGKIEFIYNDAISPYSPREDIVNDFYVRKINVKNNQDQIIKTAELFYSYFVSPDDGGLSGSYYNGIDKRLKLDSIKINNHETYQFEYYDEAPLPHRLSNAQDYWGVYNGKLDNKTTIPTTKYKLPIESEYSVYMGADKRPDITYGRLGNLKKIIYPTGGYTAIEYEADDYNTFGLIPSTNSYTAEIVAESVIGNSSTPVEEIFEIPENTYNHYVYFRGNEEMEYTIGKCYANLYIKNSQGVFELAAAPNLFYSTNYSYNGDGNPQGGIGRTAAPGTYKFILYPDENPNLECKVMYGIVKETSNNDGNNRKTGTIRVKRIEAVDGTGNNIIRRFEYRIPNESNSSGKNFGPYILNAFKKTNGPLDSERGYYYEEYKLVNNPGWNLSSVQGKPVGYRFVQEIYTSNDINNPEEYRTEYRFKNDDYPSDLAENETDDSPGDPFNDYDPNRIINNSWPVNGALRGLKLGEKHYSSNQLVKSVSYDYVYDTEFNLQSDSHPESTSLLAFGVNSSIKAIKCNNDIEFCYITYNLFVFPIKNYWVKNVHTVTAEYENNQPKMVTDQFSEYSQEYKHTFLSESITENSLGETLTAQYKYPHDLTSDYEQSSIMEKLIERNQISTPVKVKTLVNGSVTSEQRTKYYHFFSDPNDESAGLILPQYVYIKRGEMGAGASPADRKITYDKYDEHGNLLQYTMENGTPVSIIWGYNGQYPIAKVEGVAYSDIQSQANPLSASNNLTESSFDALRTMVNASNKYAMLTCYLYEPLVGVTAIIQPDGQKATYEYDDFGRLKLIKDQDGNVLKEIEYNYYNQQP